jgi:hypothetical protein
LAVRAFFVCGEQRALRLRKLHLSRLYELQTLMQFLPGATRRCVTRIDRLARSMKDLQDIVHELKEKGIARVAISETLIFRLL